jgi:cytochrome o ubiquinol oxidase subunit 2
MLKKIKVFLALGLALALGVLAILYARYHHAAVLYPNGPVGAKERNLIVLAIGLSAIVVIPVYVMLIGFAIRYREGNKKARYQPQFDRSRLIEGLWWAVPLVIILVLAVATYRGSHELDPFKPLSSAKEPITIQVIALDWKWLFIYPRQNIASVNFVEFPVRQPINFQITSDAPMNSFWIPKLGGQIYAMSGMVTSLNLMAEQAGDYAGSSANISGEGFAGMKFTARASSEADFNKWISSIERGSSSLSTISYKKLSAPSQNNSVAYYSNVDPHLFHQAAAKFNSPSQAATK